MPGTIEARMNFIIEEQARLAAGIQLLKDCRADTMRLIEANTGIIRPLVDLSMLLGHHGEETDRGLRELSGSWPPTDRRLDALIDVVDKLTRHMGG